MELINNGVNVFLLLLLALSSFFSSANSICVPRNLPQFLPSVSAEAPQNAQLAPQQAPTPQAQTPQATPQAQTPEATPQAQTPEATPQAQTTTTTTPEATDAAPTTVANNEVSGVMDLSDLNFQKLHSELEAAVVGTAKAEIVEICDVTSNPQLCKSSISTHVEGSTVDPATALKTEIGQSILEVEKAIATLNALIKDSAASHAEVECYDTCLENFEMAIDDLKAGLEAIDVKDTGKMESVLTAVMTDLTTCDDTFIEMGVDSPLDNLSTKMSKFASNCLAISKLLL